jgi:hypothetical protein
MLEKPRAHDNKKSLQMRSTRLKFELQVYAGFARSGFITDPGVWPDRKRREKRAHSTANREREHTWTGINCTVQKPFGLVSERLWLTSKLLRVLRRSS